MRCCSFWVAACSFFRNCCFISISISIAIAIGIGVSIIMSISLTIITSRHHHLAYHSPFPHHQRRGSLHTDDFGIPQEFTIKNVMCRLGVSQSLQSSGETTPVVVYYDVAYLQSLSRSELSQLTMLLQRGRHGGQKVMWRWRLMAIMTALHGTNRQWQPCHATIRSSQLARREHFRIFIFTTPV